MPSYVYLRFFPYAIPFWISSIVTVQSRDNFFFAYASYGYCIATWVAKVPLYAKVKRCTTVILWFNPDRVHPIRTCVVVNGHLLLFFFWLTSRLSRPPSSNTIMTKKLSLRQQLIMCSVPGCAWLPSCSTQPVQATVITIYKKLCQWISQSPEKKTAKSSNKELAEHAN